ncbi:unnamed protein product [Triticum turgidum subsp. durum]|uniref:Uncharacterized protein n=1 Tax=Triticum turgidum subsp. durum TaxID=4567 RepID=A0A9R0XYF4_TRITD|nr:unnamed protein product [Triticum turgidum subsp. durum]
MMVKALRYFLTLHTLHRYSTFVNWELWWPQFPILVYFKETQTKPEGQIHFFPVIFNGRQLYDIMVERAGSSETSGPGP